MDYGGGGEEEEWLPGVHAGDVQDVELQGAPGLQQAHLLAQQPAAAHHQAHVVQQLEEEQRRYQRRHTLCLLRPLLQRFSNYFSNVTPRKYTFCRVPPFTSAKPFWGGNIFVKQTSRDGWTFCLTELHMM